jgi:hypothetical protein
VSSFKDLPEYFVPVTPAPPANSGNLKGKPNKCFGTNCKDGAIRKHAGKVISISIYRLNVLVK